MADIYALSTDGVDYRYVGATRDTPGRRLTDHKIKAKRGVVRPVYDWMRSVGPSTIATTLLDRVPDDEIHEAEALWISRLRAEGHDLLNVQDGGPGRPGYRSPEEAARTGAAHVGIKHKKHEFKDITTQVVSGARGAHSRWHAARGIVNNDCVFCVGVDFERNLMSEGTV